MMCLISLGVLIRQFLLENIIGSRSSAADDENVVFWIKSSSRKYNTKLVSILTRRDTATPYPFVSVRLFKISDIRVLVSRITFPAFLSTVESCSCLLYSRLRRCSRPKMLKKLTRRRMAQMVFVIDNCWYYNTWFVTNKCSESLGACL